MDQIVIEEYAPTANKPHRVIDDAATIDRVFAALGEHDRAWSKPLGTFPAPKCTVYFQRGHELLAVVMLGAGWIGGRRGSEVSADNRTQNLAPHELNEIEEGIGVPQGSCTRWPVIPATKSTRPP